MIRPPLIVIQAKFIVLAGIIVYQFPFSELNVTQALKKEILVFIFYGTAIAKKGNERHA